MTQVIDRWSQPGPSFLPPSASTSSPSQASSRTLPSRSSPSPSSSSPSKKASHNQVLGPTKNNNVAFSSEEDAAIQRSQAFIIETQRNPLQFVQSKHSAISDMPFPAINDPKVIEERRRRRQEGQDATLAAHAPGSSSKAATSSRNGVGGTETTETSKSESPNASPKTVGKASQETYLSPVKDGKPELYPYKISLTAPSGKIREKTAGLVNRGNTCYMNSTLQALIHLSPLLHALHTKDDDQLRGRFGAEMARFDAISEMANLAYRMTSRSGGPGHTLAPSAFIKNLKAYARPLRPMRQEDAHEFLRFLLDAMQNSSLTRAPKSLKPNDPLRETTLIYKIFGGRLRSRVQCEVCKHNSDTFDPMLDLSLDIRNLPSHTLKAALHKFAEKDYLRGQNKYKCEKCRKQVEATKRFTIDHTPVCLTVHLKRFTLTGQKLSKAIQYPESLVLGKDVLSEGVRPVRYTLQSVIHHHGSGPNSGHYIASVRNTLSNRWYEANDSYVSPLREAPTGSGSAYILFYTRDASEALDEVIKGGIPVKKTTSQDGEGKGGAQVGSSTPSRLHSASDLGVKIDRAMSPLKTANGNRDSTNEGILHPLRENEFSVKSVSTSSFYGGGPSSSPSSAPSNTKRRASMMTGEDDVGEALEETNLHSRERSSPKSLLSNHGQTSYEPLTGGNDSIKNKKKRRKEKRSLNLGLRQNLNGAGGGGSPYQIGSTTGSSLLKKTQLMKGRT